MINLKYRESASPSPPPHLKTPAPAPYFLHLLFKIFQISFSRWEVIKIYSPTSELC